MKIINTYEQYDITWFNYKYLFQLGNKLTTHRNYSESSLKSWLEFPNLNINIRKRYENN